MDQIHNLKTHLLEIKDSQKADRLVLDKNISALSSIVEKFYSKENAYQERVKYFTQCISLFKIHNKDSNPLYKVSTESIMKEMNDIIDNIIKELDNIGLHQKETKIDKSVNVTTNISQNQSIEINYFYEIIKDELNGKQIKEIKEIIDSEKSSDEKKSGLITKLKSFGGDVLSNIVANIITNPDIYTKF